MRKYKVTARWSYGDSIWTDNTYDVEATRAEVTPQGLIFWAGNDIVAGFQSWSQFGRLEEKSAEVPE